TARTTGRGGTSSSRTTCPASSRVASTLGQRRDAMPGTDRTHLIGLLLGAEEDWPTAFETLAARLGVIALGDGTTHEIRTEGMTIEPFNLRDKPRQDLVVDRLAYWY